MSYYKNGIVSIPNVSGDVVITATGVQQAPHYTNLADPTSPQWLNNYRISSARQIQALNGVQVTNPIYVENGDIIRMKGHNGSTDYVSAVFPTDTETQGTNPYTSETYDSATGIDTIVIGKNGDIIDHYYRLALTTSKIIGDIIITKNEEIPV